MQLKFKKLHPAAVTPKYATDGAACFDLHAVQPDEWAIYPSVPTTVRTGLSFDIPEGYVMLIFSRSGHGFKHDTRLANCVGVIDSDYRGEVMVRLTRDSAQTPVLAIKEGDRIAQAMVVPIPVVELVEVNELSGTERGDGGFGSTGQ